MSDQRWSFWIDRGGTFTDCIGRNPASGELMIVKALSSDRAPLECIRRALNIPAGAPIPPCHVRMGTTVATNALLERRGAAVVLVADEGLADALAIGDQTRPDLFALAIRRPEVLYGGVVTVSARADRSGATLGALDEPELLRALSSARRGGASSVAVVLLHAHRSPELELRVERIARAAGFAQISLSHQIDHQIGLIGRGHTTCVDAYLTPLLRDYIAALVAELPGSRLELMQSSGGLCEATQLRGHNAILSGPAGGVVALGRIAAETGERRVIGLDIGGTSTDVSRWEERPEQIYATEIAGVSLRAPMMAIHTVAAGGGSICRYDGYRLIVGPESAGAAPGPLAYGRPEATALTVTDMDLVLGRLVGDRFPFALDHARPREALAAIGEVMADRGERRSTPEIAEGFIEVAHAHVAEAIRRVTIARGHDVRDHVLFVFGGAGGQHACGIARRLGIRRVLFHPLAGVFSAYGMGLAEVSWHGEHDVAGVNLDEGALADLEPAFVALEGRGRAALLAQGVSVCTCTRRVDLRYRGSDSILTLPIGDSALGLRQAFERAHQRSFGYLRPAHAIELVTARVEAGSRATPIDSRPPAQRASRGASSAPGRTAPAPRRRTRLFHRGAWRENVPVHWREDLAPEMELEGPALILEPTSTIALDPGFVLRVEHDGLLSVEDLDPDASWIASPDPAVRDPVSLEIYNHLFMSIAEQMGTVLERTALSTNIRERRDFSCALFDAHGGLVANAPHIPVHLGAMGETVRAVLERCPELAPGEVFASNDPGAGGSHLPDITVVTPVHDAAGRLLFFTACRGHHADVGGVTPGSMPPFSRRLEDEGIVLSAQRIVAGGRLDDAALRRAFTEARHPARDFAQNLADLEAQIAANRHGAELLGALIAERGLASVRAYMRHVQDNAAERVADAIGRLPDGVHAFEDALDDGSPIRVKVTVTGRRMIVDFTGSAPEHEGNLNAPRAVTMAAVIYVLRSLVGEAIPLNQGCLDPVQVIIPEPSLLSPAPGRAVVAGNVETSQRIVDVLLGALGLAAASQGTMNNLTFGDDRFGYYETIAGGAGAGPGFCGASGVHTHMTNTRITDPEILESRFPVRLIRFELRRGSGGRGRWPGGDGVIRELEALAPLTFSILSERRTRAPFGLAGGESGARGRNLLDGAELPAKVSFLVEPGQRIRIETPGGGGFGAPKG
ncbi:MAG: hydantoinase B/oxoprolinase family protein [Deltaproteobacteria bacterium]|nr:hydantoinase B/oxoprolinase family protein [Deltaproteobacteria bacterium]